MGWKGLSNGAMLDKAVDAGFALLIAGDGSMVHEQHPRRRSIQILPVTGTVPWTMPTKRTFEGRLTGISDDPTLGR